jgi:hypothetical protein
MFCCSWPSVDIQFGLKVVAHFLRSEAINQLWSNEYQILLVCVCILALLPDMQFTPCLYRVILSSVTCMDPPYYLQKGVIWGKDLLNMKCVMIFSTTFVWNISHSKKNSARYYQKCTWTFMKCSRYSWQIFNVTWTFSRDFRKKKPPISNFMKIRPVGAQIATCRLTDGRTDVTKLTVTLRNFANSP